MIDKSYNYLGASAWPLSHRNADHGRTGDVFLSAYKTPIKLVDK